MSIAYPKYLFYFIWERNNRLFDTCVNMIVSFLLILSIVPMIKKNISVYPLFFPFVLCSNGKFLSFVSFFCSRGKFLSFVSFYSRRCLQGSSRPSLEFPRRSSSPYHSFYSFYSFDSSFSLRKEGEGLTRRTTFCLKKYWTPVYRRGWHFFFFCHVGFLSLFLSSFRFSLSLSLSLSLCHLRTEILLYWSCLGQQGRKTKRLVVDVCNDKTARSTKENK